MEAIILAGGLGTRLRERISDLPKPMAPIVNRPFLLYLLEQLYQYNITRIVISTGYMHEKIEQYFGNKYRDIDLVYSVEEEPLGTGGAIRKAYEQINEDDILILNGDTFFNIDINAAYEQHKSSNADLTIALKAMKNFDRYGEVILLGNKVIKFEEKKFRDNGYINGGIYFAKSGLFDNITLPSKFSFEIDFMQRYLSRLKFTGYLSEAYFIDIGIPEDYARAQSELIINYEKQSSVFR